mmetsp:Transcript_89652/g.237161  ORF Transcript_89652/g.237161 Transcript_89652/m.237161 type:complete len:203 (-) Transcript_89652:174-782(-)
MELEASDRSASTRVTKLPTMLSIRETPSLGLCPLSATAASIIETHAVASGAGRVGSERNLRVVRPTKPQPISEPTRQAMMFTGTSTSGIDRPYCAIRLWASPHGISASFFSTPRRSSSSCAKLRCMTWSSGSEKITPLTIAMPAEPATWLRFRKRDPAGPLDAFRKAPQPHSTTSGLTPGVMPAFKPATTIVADRMSVTNRP